MCIINLLCKEIIMQELIIILHNGKIKQNLLQSSSTKKLVYPHFEGSFI